MTTPVTTVVPTPVPQTLSPNLPGWWRGRGSRSLWRRRWRRRWWRWRACSTNIWTLSSCVNTLPGDQGVPGVQCRTVVGVRIVAAIQGAIAVRCWAGTRGRLWAQGMLVHCINNGMHNFWAATKVHLQAMASTLCKLQAGSGHC